LKNQWLSKFTALRPPAIRTIKFGLAAIQKALLQHWSFSSDSRVRPGKNSKKKACKAGIVQEV
jgi:hypothetical protein